jgi:hypothetical protein
VGLEVWSHTFIILALDGGKWIFSRRYYFTLKKKTLVFVEEVTRGPLLGAECIGEEQVFFLRRELNRVFHPVTSDCWLKKTVA